MSKIVLLATEKPFVQVALTDIEKVFTDAGFQMVKLENYKQKSDLLAAVANVHAMIVRSDIIDREVIEVAKNLKIVVRAGAGYDNIDLPAATSKNIVVMNTPGQNSNAVAELVMMMLLYLARSQFSGKSGNELRGKKIGIHAFGNVGSLVAQIAKGFGMDTYAYDPFVPKEKIETQGIKVFTDMHEMYRTCDYISLHLPKTKDTIKLINYDLLSIMPEGATVINTARKEVICEDSVLKMMKTRSDFRYATDITPDNDQEMKTFGERYYSTPKKMGAQTEEANINAGIAAAKQIVAFFEKGDTTFKVN